VIVSQNNRNKHYRWLFFILFSAIVGGKIATATSQAMRLDARETEEKQRLWRTARSAGAAAINLLAIGRSCVFAMFHRVLSTARKH
jgi:hypothetical protein